MFVDVNRWTGNQQQHFQKNLKKRLKKSRCTEQSWTGNETFPRTAHSLSHVRLFVTPWTAEPARLLCPWNFPGKNTGVGCHFLLQGIFPTQGSNPNLLCLLHWQVDSFPLSHLGSPFPRTENSLNCPRTSLVVQWLRICLPIQGTWVKFLVQEDPHVVEQLSPCTPTTTPLP